MNIEFRSEDNNLWVRFRYYVISLLRHFVQFFRFDAQCCHQRVTEDFLSELFASIAADPAARVRVDVPAQTVTNLATGRSECFELNAYKKYCLTHALDDIDYLLEQKDKIEAFEKARK